MTLSRCPGLLLTLATILLYSSPAESTIILRSTDLWDVNQGASIVSDSGTLGSWTSVNSIGGLTHSSGHTLFRDDRPNGFVHWINWQIPASITLQSFTLSAAHDGGSRDARYRGFSSFTLFGWNASTTTFESLFSIAPANPYAGTVPPPGVTFESNGHNLLTIGANLAPYTTNLFRAEFVQRSFSGSHGHASGPRIIELDGYDTVHPDLLAPVPEPGTMALLLSGFGVLGWRRRGKSRDERDRASACRTSGRDGFARFRFTFDA